jgi:hypothetical protein
MSNDDFNALIRAQAAMFVALGGTMGTRALLHASTLLADLALDEALDTGTRQILQRVVSAADASVVRELEQADSGR